MRKVFRILLVIILVVGIIGAGIFAFLKFGRAPISVTARTLANLREIDSASMNMRVDAGVKAEVGILQFFGIDDPETTISMDYDIDVFTRENLAHANVKIKAFDTNILDNVEVVLANDGDRPVQYYRFNDNWYRYTAGHETAADETSGAEDIAESDMTVKLNASSENNSGGFVKLSVDKETGKEEEYVSIEDAANNAYSFVDFREILEGIERGDLSVSMREEKELERGRECFVYDMDITGDMLEKVIRLSVGNKGLITGLNADEHVTGTLYIDSEENLPTKLKLSTREILSNKLVLEQIRTTFSVNKIDIDVDVTGYNTAKAVSVPEEFVDLNNSSELDSNKWFGLFLDLIGVGSAG